MYWNIFSLCYNLSRDVMKKVEISVYSNFNNIEENNAFLAIKDNKVIKYIDIENNKMSIDMENNIIVRENSDYLFNIDFNNNKIYILMKKLNKKFEKAIKTMVIEASNTKYLVRYLLIDENIINEYYVKFWNNSCIINNKMI